VAVATKGRGLLKVLLAVLLLKTYAVLLLYVFFREVEPRPDYTAFLHLERGETREAKLARAKASFIERLAPFDGQFYLDVARGGYRRFEPPRRETMHLAATQGNFAFFPLLPWGLRALGAAESRAGLGVALLLNGLLGALACAGVWLLARSLGFPAGLALAMLLAYPAAIFQLVVYTESVFLFLSVAAALALRSGRSGTAAVLGCLGGLCRPQGVLLAALGAGRLGAGHGGPRLRSRLLVVLGPLLGLATFSAILAAALGAPLGFIEIQRDWGREFSLAGLIAGLSDPERLGAPLDRLALLLGLGLLPFLWKHLPRPLALYGTASALLPLLSGSTLSYGRFLSVSFPHFLCLAKVFEKWKLASAVLLAGFVFLQALVAKGLMAWSFVG
jgi:hypothetical protein